MEMVEQDVLPMLDALDTEDDSPYLRRKKSVPIRRSRISRRLRVGLILIAVLLPFSLALYGLLTFALTSPIFVLTSPEDIVVEGNHYVSRGEVLGALGLKLTGKLKTGTNVFRLSLDAALGGVQTLPWVRTASVTRILPHGLLVHITERTPVAYTDVDGQVILIDEDGMPLGKTDNGVFDFPVVYGVEDLVNLEDRRARLALYLDFTRQLGVEALRAGWTISEVNLTDAEDLKALLIKGQQTLQVHFGQRDFLQRFQNFLKVLPEIQKSNGKLDSIDLRYRNQIIVDPQTPAPALDGRGHGQP
jgi:cell division protein FtsQ